MKEIYLFTTHAMSDGEDLGINTRVFENYNDAKKAFNEYVEGEKPYVNDWEVDEDDVSFEAWEEGQWCNNHTYGRIEKHSLSTTPTLVIYVTPQYLAGEPDYSLEELKKLPKDELLHFAKNENEIEIYDLVSFQDAFNDELISDLGYILFV